MFSLQMARPRFIFTRGRRYSRKVNRQIAFLATLRASYGSTNCCQTDSVRFWLLRCRQFPGKCRSLSGINFFANAIGEVALCRFSRSELTNFIQSSPNIKRLLIEFATRELDMAEDQLLLLGNGSAEKVAIFLVSWRNRLAHLSVFSETVPLPMRRQDIADFFRFEA